MMDGQTVIGGSRVTFATYVRILNTKKIDRLLQTTITLMIFSNFLTASSEWTKEHENVTMSKIRSVADILVTTPTNQLKLNVTYSYFAIAIVDRVLHQITLTL